ncbi:hypothetical protein MRS44_015984 [Fusarium solani]|jgi:hypothetical protein|uniref:Uncharacterized protein n=1 Tax=Fusarium solani TaxID=169388 RepID=A0A9P9G3P5_FUSSL|nr:uncharacterized protein B0J15DRAFT_555761 [Fusarium solani]KAH7231437.1 hypothetical protein B0J15DRAFT_555761 [Fusarium solani]KAJ3459911.1 hypothetical protein MRS44_015984 [Fusarium solani]KAJ4199352.1 hypothetical protein NW759_016137 [Fusarium solani]
MHIPTTVSVFALAAAAVNAVPDAGISDDGVVEKRKPPVIQLFSGTCFQGPIVRGFAVGQCRNLPANSNNMASSGKTSHGFRCTIFANNNCQGDSYRIIGQDPKFCRLNNRASSWKCVQD